MDILNDILDDRDVDLIRRIPLSLRPVSDVKQWRWGEDGRFSVKSCYRRIVGEINPVNWTGWTEMWNWKIPRKIKIFFWQVCSGCLPTKDLLRARQVNCSGNCGLCGSAGESLLHIFKLCPVAQEAWRTAARSWTSYGGDNFMEQLKIEFQSRRKESLEVLIGGCWALWCERNRRVWQRVSSSAKVFMDRAHYFISGWKQAQFEKGRRPAAVAVAPTNWRRPAPGRLKLNVDAAVRSDRCGLGWCLRDEDGNFVAGTAMPWPGILSSLEAELIAIREALSWLQGTGWQSVEVESDASRAISEIKKHTSFSSFGLIAEDIRELATNFANISFFFTRRSANKLAHSIAKAACSMSYSCSWFYVIPSFLSCIFYNDLINKS
ncbi:unnamed protein product [Cuscuta epithymum]|uniref:RNase H type-1 domain-containing protein n=1 Tax=Cuscuta epithymum TaxID=186058 RepID=A0AAV0CIZ9_9ASTE|nr:unnamed protein product [Cuscuta epithymum]